MSTQGMRDTFEYSNLHHKVYDDRIKQGLDAGKFVVVMKTIAYCPITDAVLHNPSHNFISEHNTREEAETAAVQVMKELDESLTGYDDFVGLDVLPKEK